MADTSKISIRIPFTIDFDVTTDPAVALEENAIVLEQNAFGLRRQAVSIREEADLLESDADQFLFIAGEYRKSAVAVNKAYSKQ